jgi:YidC/Oxa1 family membrane protein insertase
MNRLMLYVFPIGVVVGAPFLPLAVLLYWVSNNLWTLGQQYVVYRKIDAEESAKREQTAANRQARAPRPGQKPVRPETAAADEKPAKRPGAKPITPKPAGSGTNGAAPASEKKTSGNGAGVNGSKGGADRAARGGGGTRPPARRPRKRR